MAPKLTLYVCHIDDRGPKPHACRRAHEALREAGHAYETVIFDKGHYFGLFTKGRRPKLKQLSGQEKLPVLQWSDGTTIAGSAKIVAWARANRPDTAAQSAVALVEFPADDPDRALRFWNGLLDTPLKPRSEDEGIGWQTSSAPPIGVHPRGRGPGDSFSLPYLAVDDLPKALERVKELGGSVVHPGESWAICKDSEGSPFGLTARARGGPM
jgi:predicted enzyme related to lactoylglutathione lyase